MAMVDKIGQNKVGASEETRKVLGENELEASPKIDSAASSIEKSKSVKLDIVPPMGSPILSAPSQECEAFAVASLDASGHVVTHTIHSFVLKGEEIKNAALEAWMQNLREIEDYVRQLLMSPAYQQMQDILTRGDSHLGTASRLEGIASADGVAAAGQVELLSALDRWRALNRVSPSEKGETAPESDEAGQILILPLTAALLAGGGLAITHGVVHTSNPMGGVFEMVEKLQPLFPAVSVQDIVPLINLMIVTPLYFNSWNEAVNSLRGRDRQNHLPAIHSFAKDVIKIVVDPHFVLGVLIQQMNGVDNLSPVDQERLSRMLKVILVGVALSLLYSLEVGKVQNGKFGGMEPEELKDLLMGGFKPLPDPSQKLTEHEQLVSSLIARCWELLEPMSVEDRASAVDMLLSYVAKHRDVDRMLDPAKVFDEAINAAHFDPKNKTGFFRG